MLTKLKHIFGKFSFIDITLVCLYTWYIVSWKANGADETGHALLMGLLPYGVLYVGLRLLMMADRAKMEVAIVIACCTCCIIESCCGLCQVFGIKASGNAIFTITGHFSNPGPFGGFVACLTAVASSYLILSVDGPKYLRVLTFIAAVCGALVIPASMSRAAWAGFVAGLIATLSLVKKYREVAARHSGACISVAAIIFALAVGAFFLKLDSALGRVHIWQMDLLTIFRHPLFGSGPGFGLGAYGISQENWFISHPEQLVSWHAKAAGCPEYAFNELLGIGMEVGIPGFVMTLYAVTLSIVRLFKCHSPLVSGMICIVVFSCASYPLSTIMFPVLIVALLAFSGTCTADKSENNRNLLPSIAGFSLSIVALAMLLLSKESDRVTDVRAIYEEGHMLFNRGDFEESIKTLSEGKRRSSDVMFGIIIGRSHEALGHMDEAENEYRAAHFRVPCRLYPLVRLMRLQIRMGENAEAMETARSILDMPVNSRHAAMKRLHDETESCLDSLMSLTDNTITCTFK